MAENIAYFSAFRKCGTVSSGQLVGLFSLGKSPYMAAIWPSKRPRWTLVSASQERWLSGRRHRFRKPACSKGHRGFESLPLRIEKLRVRAGPRREAARQKGAGRAEKEPVA